MRWWESGKRLARSAAVDADYPGRTDFRKVFWSLGGAGFFHDCRFWGDWPAAVVSGVAVGAVSLRRIYVDHPVIGDEFSQYRDPVIGLGDRPNPCIRHGDWHMVFL